MNKYVVTVVEATMLPAHLPWSLAYDLISRCSSGLYTKLGSMYDVME